MKRILPLLLLIVVACKGKTDAVVVEDSASSVETDKVQVDVDLPFKVFDYDGIAPLLNKADDKVHVVNFWATWCAPCIKELPYFEKLGKSYADENVEVLLVSLDFPNKYHSKLVPFLERKNIGSKVVALDDVDQNRWIPLIDSTWSGALPATIIYSSKQRKFYEQSFTYEELENELKQFIN